MKDPYITCYLSGRSDEYEDEVDIDKIVEKATAAGNVSVREASHAAAKAAIASEMDTTAKVEWLKDNMDAIRDMGGDTEKAWRLYTQGRVDMLAYNLEDEALTAIFEAADDEDDEDDEGEDEGDENENEESEDEDGEGEDA